MIVLSIDTGSSVLGWAVFRDKDLIAHGHNDYDGNYTGKKLLDIYTDIWGMISKYDPDIIVCESYFAGQGRGACVIPEVRGTIRLATAIIGKEIEEISYPTVQKVLTGDGRCGKPAVRAMIEKSFSTTVEVEDESDAIGIAYAWIMTHKEMMV